MSIGKSILCFIDVFYFSQLNAKQSKKINRTNKEYSYQCLYWKQALSGML